MKYLQRLIVLFTISAAIFSCQKEYSIENPTGSNTPTAQWEFKEAGVQFKGPVDTVAVDTIGTYKFLTINGRSTDGNSQITLQVFGADLKVGTYKTPFSLFAYLTAGNPVYQTDQTATDSFTITITKIDTTGVTGTFSGNALSGNNGKKIVDGKFNAVFKRATPVPPSSTDSGQVVLWSKAGCGGGTSTSPIAVTVGGKAGSITKFLAAEPTTCDPAGAYFVKLPVGTYPWVAKCGTDSVTGTVTVTKGGCTKQEVNFSAAITGDYFPTTLKSNWSYLYENSTPDDTLYTVSAGVKSIGASSYSVFTNTDGSSKDSSYYRKTPGSYYEYIPAFTDTAAGGIAIPAFEYTFLKDNAVKGATYSSAAIAATIQSVPVTMTINSTVLDITTIVVNTQTLPVIKMRHVYTYKLASISTDFYAVEEWFAKGVGLVKYIDYSSPPFTTASDVLNLTKATIY